MKYLLSHLLQHEDENRVVNTYTFTNLKDTFNFITQPDHKDFIVIAHCGGRFDFQLLYKHFLSSDVMRQGHQKDPLMKGQKITEATLIHNIRLIDSYNFASQPFQFFQLYLQSKIWQKEIFLIYSTSQNFRITVVLLLLSTGMPLIANPHRKDKN